MSGASLKWVRTVTVHSAGPNSDRENQRSPPCSGSSHNEQCRLTELFNQDFIKSKQRRCSMKFNVSILYTLYLANLEMRV